MSETREIRISSDVARAIEDHLADLGATTIEEYVEAVLRSQLQQAGHLSAYSEEEEEEIERRLRELGYLD
jgi:hypothetical protein